LSQPKKNIAIFASGGGSNARSIIAHFKDSAIADVALVVSNKPDAGVLKIAAENGIPTVVIQRKPFYETDELLEVLHAHHIDFIALAGFLWLVPQYLVAAYPKKIVNIHPALLPAYGGKGMYGIHVHTAVKAAGETESGMTIHYVNDHYDEGDIVFQAKVSLEKTDTPEDIARKVLTLEHRHFPQVIETLLTDA